MQGSEMNDADAGPSVEKVKTSDEGKRPMRKFRKAVSKISGVSGFLSGKKSSAPAPKQEDVAKATEEPPLESKEVEATNEMEIADAGSTTDSPALPVPPPVNETSTTMTSSKEKDGSFSEVGPSLFLQEVEVDDDDANTAAVEENDTEDTQLTLTRDNEHLAQEKPALNTVRQDPVLNLLCGGL